MGLFDLLDKEERERAAAGEAVTADLAAEYERQQAEAETARDEQIRQAIENEQTPEEAGIEPINPAPLMSELPDPEPQFESAEDPLANARDEFSERVDQKLEEGVPAPEPRSGLETDQVVPQAPEPPQPEPAPQPEQPAVSQADVEQLTEMAQEEENQEPQDDVLEDDVEKKTLLERFGISPEDWDKFKENLKKGAVSLLDVIGAYGAGYAGRDYNSIIEGINEEELKKQEQEMQERLIEEERAWAAEQERLRQEYEDRRLEKQAQLEKELLELQQQYAASNAAAQGLTFEQFISLMGGGQAGGQ
jgi:hypothetical protein